VFGRFVAALVVALACAGAAMVAINAAGLPTITVAPVMAVLGVLVILRALAPTAGLPVGRR
jgi:hypothetical protein